MSDPTCPVCALFEQPSPDVVFMNDEIMVVAPAHGLALGHVQIFPRRHVPLIEQLSHDEIAAVFAAGNALSSVLFELVRAQGTNLIMQNGLAAGQSVAHTSVHVIPRKQDDGIEFTWELKRADQQELTATAAALKEQFIPPKSELGAGETGTINLDRRPTVMGAGGDDGPAPRKSPRVRPPSEDAPAADGKERQKKERINYLLKQLERMP